jgi:TRAP-type C4-dicarboxylate transport system substrate-binding protein
MITRRTFTTGAATMLAAGHLSTRAKAATASWDMSTVWPEGNFHTQNAMAFAEEVRKQTDGAVNITVKAGGQLGFKGPEHLRAVRDGHSAGEGFMRWSSSGSPSRLCCRS